jgi:hypothetical protein
LGSAWERSSRQSLRADVDEGAVDAGWSNDLAGRRRSTRLFLANGDVDEDGADEESDGEPHPPEPAPRPTRLVTLKLVRSAANGRAAKEPHVAAWEGNGATESVLHMEDWEMDEGRVNTAGEGMLSLVSPPSPPFRFINVSLSIGIFLDVSHRQPDGPGVAKHQLSSNHCHLRPNTPVPSRCDEDPHVHASQREAQGAGRPGRIRRWVAGHLQDYAG